MHNPNKVIVDINNDGSVVDLLYELYKPLNYNNAQIILMDTRSAELTKYIANSMLATKISFVNETSNLAKIFEADAEKVRQGIGADSRIRYSFIDPGCEYGSSCFSKNIQALINTAE